MGIGLLKILVLCSFVVRTQWSFIAMAHAWNIQGVPCVWSLNGGEQRTRRIEGHLRRVHEHLSSIHMRHPHVSGQKMLMMSAEDALNLSDIFSRGLRYMPSDFVR